MRYAVIDWLDCVFYDSNDLDKCIEVFQNWKDSAPLRGVYDYEDMIWMVEDKEEDDGEQDI